MRSYRPDELFDRGRLRAEIARLAPDGDRRMGASPYANGGRLRRDLDLPDFRDYAVDVPAPDATHSEPTRVLGVWLAGHRAAQPADIPHHRSGRDRVQPAVGGVRGHQPHLGRRDPARRRPPGARRAGDGGAFGAPVPGLARGLPAHRAARAVQLLRGVRPHRRLDVQPARQVAEGDPAARLASPHLVAQLPVVEPCLAPGPQRLLPPGPGLHRPCGQEEGRGGAGLPTARRQLPAVGDGSLPAQRRLRQRGGGGQERDAQLAGDGRCDRPLHGRHRHLGLGLDRGGRHRRVPGRGAGVLR